jgi:hypothetical protein
VPPRKATEADAPRISVIDRRLKNPFGTPSREIPLKGEKRNWVVRTFAADPEHPNRHYDAVHRLGWIPLKEDDLAVTVDSLGYVVSPTGSIVRGDKGHEVLMGMPRADFNKIQASKGAANLASLKLGKVKAEVAQATAKEHGDEAGEQTNAHFTQQEFVGPVAD